MSHGPPTIAGKRWLKIPIGSRKVIEMAHMKAIQYSRVSTDMQDVHSQRLAVQHYIEANNIIVVKEYTDESRQGDDESRPAYNDMLKHLNDQDFDAVLCFDVDRLSRSMDGGIDFIMRCKKASKKVIVARTGQIFDYMNESDMLVGLISAWHSSVEKNKIRERVKAGVAAARAEKYDGRWGAKPKKVSLSRYAEYKSMGLSDRQAAKLLGCCRNTLSKRLREQQALEQVKHDVID